MKGQSRAIAVLCASLSGQVHASPCVTDSFDVSPQDAVDVQTHRADVPSAQFPGLWQSGRLGGYYYELAPNGSGFVAQDSLSNQWEVSFICDPETDLCTQTTLGPVPDDAMAVAELLGACLLGPKDEPEPAAQKKKAEPSSFLVATDQFQAPEPEPEKPKAAEQNPPVKPADKAAEEEKGVTAKPVDPKATQPKAAPVKPIPDKVDLGLDEAVRKQFAAKASPKPTPKKTAEPKVGGSANTENQLSKDAGSKVAPPKSQADSPSRKAAAKVSAPSSTTNAVGTTSPRAGIAEAAGRTQEAKAAAERKPTVPTGSLGTAPVPLSPRISEITRPTVPLGATRVPFAVLQQVLTPGLPAAATAPRTSTAQPPRQQPSVGNVATVPKTVVSGQTYTSGQNVAGVGVLPVSPQVQGTTVSAAKVSQSFLTGMHPQRLSLLLPNSPRQQAGTGVVRPSAPVQSAASRSYASGGLVAANPVLSGQVPLATKVTCGVASLPKGSKSLTLQRLLLAAGEKPGALDGVVGRRTVQAVERLFAVSYASIGIDEAISRLDALLCTPSQAVEQETCKMFVMIRRGNETVTSRWEEVACPGSDNGLINPQPTQKVEERAQ